MAGVIDIPELWAAIAAKVNTVLSERAIDPFNVYYDYGRYIEVTKNLTTKDAGIEAKHKKYPLIWLVVPYSVAETMLGIDCEIMDMMIIIATRTIQESNTPDRIEKNFRPRLWPIYDELRNQIERSGYFTDIDFDNKHVRVDQPFWIGDEKGSGAANLFNDYIDAIQLKNIRLKVTEQTCDRFRLITGIRSN